MKKSSFFGTHDKLQESCVTWLKFYSQSVLIVLVNNNPKNKVDGARLLKLGLKKGVSDIIVFTKNKDVFVEFKFGKDVQKYEQAEFERNIKNNYRDYIVVRNLDEFMNYFKKIL